MLRDWTMSEKVNGLSVHAERFFTRLIMKVDDYGGLFAHTSLLKASLFPLLLDAIREADISRWMAECQKAGLIVLYEAEGKKYVQICDFRQRLDKAKAKYPLPSNSCNSVIIGNDFPEAGNDFPAEVEEELELEGIEANASAGEPPAHSQQGKKLKGSRANSLLPKDNNNLQSDYKQLLRQFEGKPAIDIWSSLKTFIQEKRPDFIEPYVDCWNVFVNSTTIKTNHLSEVEALNDTRRKKIKTRASESAFDFIKILEKIKKHSQWRGDNSSGWKVDFDWILENDSNYVKIIERNY